MTHRLPTVGGDSGTWGTVLNDFLGVSMNTDGTLTGTAVGSAFALVSVKTANYTAGGTQGEIVLANANSGGFTVTLPTAVGNSCIYSVKKTDSSSNNVTIATTSSQTIDGGSTAVIKLQYASVMVVSDGSNWQVV